MPDPMPDPKPNAEPNAGPDPVGRRRSAGAAAAPRRA